MALCHQRFLALLESCEILTDIRSEFQTHKVYWFYFCVLPDVIYPQLLFSQQKMQIHTRSLKEAEMKRITARRVCGTKMNIQWPRWDLHTLFPSPLALSSGRRRLSICSPWHCRVFLEKEAQKAAPACETC